MVTQKNSFSGSFLVRQCADKKSMYGFYEKYLQKHTGYFCVKGFRFVTDKVRLTTLYIARAKVFAAA
jgi:hypothetical protein